MKFGEGVAHCAVRVVRRNVERKNKELSRDLKIAGVLKQTKEGLSELEERIIQVYTDGEHHEFMIPLPGRGILKKDCFCEESENEGSLDVKV